MGRVIRAHSQHSWLERTKRKKEKRKKIILEKMIMCGVVKVKSEISRNFWKKSRKFAKIFTQKSKISQKFSQNFSKKFQKFPKIFTQIFMRKIVSQKKEKISSRPKIAERDSQMSQNTLKNSYKQKYIHKITK